MVGKVAAGYEAREVVVVISYVAELYTIVSRSITLVMFCGHLLIFSNLRSECNVAR